MFEGVVTDGKFRAAICSDGSNRGWAAGIICQTGAVSPPVYEKKTEVVMLGTGDTRMPIRCFGPATAIVVHGTPYLVGCGPGWSARRTGAEERRAGLTPQRIGVVFITHLHSNAHSVIRMLC